MKKKVLSLLVALLFVFGLVACTETTTTTTTSGTTTTTTSGSTFSIALAGLTDAGMTEEDVIYAGEYFDLLAGVTALGSDLVDYKDQITFTSEDAACQIADGKLMAEGAKTCIVTYTVVVQSKLARANRSIKITAAPVVMEFTATTKWDNAVILGTDYVVTETQGAVNTFYYWAINTAVLGTTGGIQVLDDKLIIDQETLSGANYGLQTMMLTDIAIEAKRYYKITFTLTSESDRYIDIVTKAPNNDYDNDTHSLIDVKTGTHDYEMVFVANQSVLHMNIMTGFVEGSINAGRLEFSNFVLYEGPINVEYTELTDFFKNDAIAVGTAMEFITGSDIDYVREFYYWNQGTTFTGTTTATGIDVVVESVGTETWVNQLQWNDLSMSGTPLKKDAKYKLTFSVNSPVARVIKVEITGMTNSLPGSASQDYSLKAGNNDIVLEFTSLYSYFFMKVQMGNFGDTVSTGTFNFTNFNLFEEAGAVDPVDPVAPPFGNVFEIENAAMTSLKGDQVDNTFYLWNGEGSSLTTVYTGSEVVLDIANLGTQFWAIQLKYSGTDLKPGTSYELYFEVESTVARKINIQIKDAAYGSTYKEMDVMLVAGLNRIVLPFTDETGSFNMQLNLGKFDDTTTAGQLRFHSFVLTLPTVEVEDYVVNGDFTTVADFAATDAEGWAKWKTEGIADAWALPNYTGTEVIADGVMTITTTQKGGAVWALQIQYNHPEADADMIVGAYYRVEFDVNSNVATTAVFQLKGASDGENIDVNYALAAGDNHVVLYYKANQARFRFFMLLGFQEAGTVLEFDNMQYFALNPGTPLVEAGNRFGTPVNTDEAAITTDAGDRYEFYVWAATWNATSWTGNFTDGEANIDVVNAGDAFWNIQLLYRGGLLTVTHDYILTFTVDSEVARTINVQLKDKAGNGTYFDQNVVLTAGVNNISLPFTAGLPVFNMQLNLGSFNGDPLVIEEGLLSFSAFKVVRPLELVEDYFANGDFATAAALGATDTAGWAVWKTEGVTDAWALPNYTGTEVIADGKLTTTTTQKGGAVWALQIQYNHATSDMRIGDLYKIEFDVNASVATTVTFQLKGKTDAENIDIVYPLLAGNNHVVLEYYAIQAQFRFLILLGLQEVGTILSFDNFIYYQPFIPTAADFPIGNIFVVENAEAALPGPDAVQNNFTLWAGIAAWFANWTEYPEVVTSYADGVVSLDIIQTGAPEFYGIQLKYKGGDLAIDTAYRLSFDIDAEVARTIRVQIYDAAFGGTQKDVTIVLVAGMNHIVIDFTATKVSFGLQINLGQFDPLVVEEGLFLFSDFMLTRPTFEVVDYVDNGDFATAAALAATDAPGWAVWKTEGNPADWALPNYIGTETIAAGVLTITTTQKGGEVWGLQIQYNAPTADLIVGAMYRVEFDVNASVATTITVQMKATSDDKNVDVVVALAAGANHVVVYMVAPQETFRLLFLLGLQEPGTVLVFDNVKLFAPANEFPIE